MRIHFSTSCFFLFLLQQSLFAKHHPITVWYLSIFLFKHNCLLLSILNTHCWGTDVAHSKPTTSFLMALFTQEWVPSGTLINTPLVLSLSRGVSTGQNHSSMAMSEQVAGGTSVWSPVMDGDGAITNGSSFCALWSIWTSERTHMPCLTDAAQGLCGTMWLLDVGEREWWKGREAVEVRANWGSETRGARLWIRYCLSEGKGKPQECLKWSSNWILSNMQK